MDIVSLWGQKHYNLIKKGSYIVDIVVEDVVGNQASKLRAKIVVGHFRKSSNLRRD